MADKVAKEKHNLPLSFTTDSSQSDVSSLASDAVCGLHVNHISCKVSHNGCHYNVSHLPPDLTGAKEINMKLKF